MNAILGISALYHDSAAALIIDGNIVAAAQEERFTRKKHDPSYTKNAIKYVLDEANLSLNQIAKFKKDIEDFKKLLTGNKLRYVSDNFSFSKSPKKNNKINYVSSYIQYFSYIFFVILILLLVIIYEYNGKRKN